MEPLLFVHIPKTAGTSFRMAAQKAFGARNVVCDYGSKAGETSDRVRELMQGPQKDPWRLYQRMVADRQSMLCGHFPAKRYVGGFGAARTVTFLRDPVERVYSEYQHFLRHRDYQASFRDFYHRRLKINQQSKKFEQVPLEAFGFVGLTEDYPRSLELINALYGLKLKPLEENVGGVAPQGAHTITEEELAELKNLNRRDMQLYRRGKALFEQRLSLFEQKLPFVHGHLKDVSERRAAGWAYWEGSADDPVKLEIRVNGEVVTTAVANALRPGIGHFGPPRGSYVGFAAAIRAKVGDKVDCVVSKTGQVIPPTPRAIAPKTR